MLRRFPKKPLKAYGITSDEMFLPGVFRWPWNPLKHYGLSRVEFYGEPTWHRNKGQLTFDAFCQAIRKAKLKSQSDYSSAIRDGRLPATFPTNPNRTFAHEWMGWLHALGMSYFGKGELTFKKFCKIIREARIASCKDYVRARKDGRLPLGMPSQPESTFRKEWRGWPHALGRSSVKHVSFPVFVKSVRAAKIRSHVDFLAARKDGRLSIEFPSAPAVFYGDIWPGWPEVLGKRRKGK